MISVLEARKLIDQHIEPLVEEETLFSLAHGRVLREPVVSPEDMPAFDRSAMDGYAVRLDETALDLEVVGEIRAGQSEDRELKPGQTIRILTGARLPGSGLKVVMQEHVEASTGRIRIVKQNPATNVRKRGEDARAGEVLLESGVTLNAAALALLASVGKTTVRVSKLPRILHLTTGDEIVSPEQTPQDGQIRNSNASLVAGLCREAGVAVDHFHGNDDLSALLEIFSRAKVETYDMVLISGGSGQGTYDFSAELFKRLGASIHFREINVRPGKPLIFGTVSKSIRHPELVEGSAPGKRSTSQETAQIVIGLPGNALSHFVCFQLFVRRALDRFLARASLQPVQAFLSEPMAETTNARETWWPALAGLKDGRLECRALAWKSSGDITRLPAANALIQVPSSTPHFPAGTMVNLLLTQNALT